MFGKKSRFSAALASAAVLSMVASPAFAQSWGGGWGDNWGGGWGRHRSHVDAGDILAGILIIGGIAAIANAASKSKRDRRDDDRRYPGDYPRERSNGYGNDNDQQWQQNGGVDNAVNRCSNEVSRGSGRTATVDTINRDGDGWRVQGRTDEGRAFACAVDGSGRIRNVQVDGQAY